MRIERSNMGASYEFNVVPASQQKHKEVKTKFHSGNTISMNFIIKDMESRTTIKHMPDFRSYLLIVL
jgi:hypothetical protein